MGQRPWWLELTNIFALLLFAPLLLLIRRAADSLVLDGGAVAAALALFVALFGARFIRLGAAIRRHATPRHDL